MLILAIYQCILLYVSSSNVHARWIRTLNFGDRKLDFSMLKVILRTHILFMTWCNVRHLKILAIRHADNDIARETRTNVAYRNVDWTMREISNVILDRKSRRTAPLCPPKYHDWPLPWPYLSPPIWSLDTHAYNYKKGILNLLSSQYTWNVYHYLRFQQLLTQKP